MTAERMLWCVLVGGTCGLVSGLYHGWKERRRKERRKNKGNIRKIFICSPFRADSIEGIRRNFARAREVAWIVATSFFECPIVPHIYCTQFLNDADEFERWLGQNFGIEFLRMCDEMYVIGSEISEGMEKEIIYALNNNIPIRLFKLINGRLERNIDHVWVSGKNGNKMVHIDLQVVTKGGKINESVD